MAQRRVRNEFRVRCPFCDYPVQIAMASNMPWCAGCRVEWYESRDGEEIVFDDKRKTPKYAWAKAFAAAGGMRIGSIDPKDK